MRMWRSLALASALFTVLTLSPAGSFAQTLNERHETTVTLAPSAGGVLASEWLGPHHGPSPDWSVNAPFWQGRGAMFVERQLAQRAVRSFWPEHIDDAKAAAILDGFAGYLQTRAIERLFDQAFLRPGHSYDTLPYFGGHVIWSFPPLRLSRHAVATRDRYAAVFASLERWIGTPTLQGAMFQIAQLPQDRLTADVIVTTISNAAGQDLSWLFAAAETEISYGVTALTPTSVTVTRKGAGMFTGRSAERAGDFESGDAVRLNVVFGSGETTTVRWDGRDQSRTFQFQAPSPVTAAFLDPEGIITLDQNRLDNSIVPARPTNVPVRKWVARWMVWLQHTMLSYGMLT
jgi:hypothetical protein